MTIKWEGAHGGILSMFCSWGLWGVLQPKTTRGKQRWETRVAKRLPNSRERLLGIAAVLWYAAFPPRPSACCGELFCARACLVLEETFLGEEGGCVCGKHPGLGGVQAEPDERGPMDGTGVQSTWLATRKTYMLDEQSTHCSCGLNGRKRRENSEPEPWIELLEEKLQTSQAKERPSSLFFSNLQ